MNKTISRSAWCSFGLSTIGSVKMKSQDSSNAGDGSRPTNTFVYISVFVGQLQLTIP